jgi:N-methylhydantoinase A
MEEKLARPLDLTIEQAAWGVHEVVNENMANAARIHAVEKGLDPRRFSLVAFGGAGPVHAYQVARKLGLETIIIPPGAGVCSAFGFLLAPMSFDLSRSYVTRLADIAWNRLNAIYDEMETTGRSLLIDAGVADKDIRFIRSADMRYVGQGFEVNVPLPEGDFSSGSAAAFRQTFEKNYQNIYQRVCEDISIEGVNWRVTATGPHPNISAIQWWSEDRVKSNPLKEKRKAYLPNTGEYVDIPVYDRYALSEGSEIEGPAIVEEQESTLVINGPGRAAVDEFSNIVVQMKYE